MPINFVVTVSTLISINSTHVEVSFIGYVLTTNLVLPLWIEQRTAGYKAAVIPLNYRSVYYKLEARIGIEPILTGL